MSSLIFEVGLKNPGKKNFLIYSLFRVFIIRLINDHPLFARVFVEI